MEQRCQSKTFGLAWGREGGEKVRDLSRLKTKREKEKEDERKERRREKRKKTREKKEDERKERRREKGKKTREREEAADLVLVSKKKLRLDFRPNSPPTPLPPPNSIECSVFEHEITKKILFVKFTAAS